MRCHREMADAVRNGLEAAWVAISEVGDLAQIIETLKRSRTRKPS